MCVSQTIYRDVRVFPAKAYVAINLAASEKLACATIKAPKAVKGRVAVFMLGSCGLPKQCLNAQVRKDNPRDHKGTNDGTIL